ncbi:MAG: hypothetical protein ACI9H8_001536 [Lysobacterales bacterium]|jgi:hypothetical protein
MDQFNTPWQVTSAAIYTTPTDSSDYGTLDFDVTETNQFIESKQQKALYNWMVNFWP